MKSKRQRIGKKKEGGQGARANRRGFGSPEEKKKEENNLKARKSDRRNTTAQHQLIVPPYPLAVCYPADPAVPNTHINKKKNKK